MPGKEAVNVQVPRVPPQQSWSAVIRVGIGAAALAASVATAQAQTAPATGTPQPAGTFKNVQELKDLTPARLRDTMVYFAAAMGGNCSSCHVRGADGEFAYEKDDNEHKTIARSMIPITRAINVQHYKGEARVTCATCHQGRLEPSPVLGVAQPMTADQLAARAPQPGRGGAGAPGAGGRQAAGAPPAAGQPPDGGGRAPGAGGGRGPQRPTETVDQVLDRYLQAVGGRDAMARMKTRTRTGTVTNRGGQVTNVVVQDTSAGQVRTSIEGPAPTTRAYDGKVAWSQTGQRVRDHEGVEATNISLAADLALPVAVKGSYTALGVQNYGRIAGHQVISLQGRRATGVSEQLMFDRESGLLARRIIRLSTPAGDLPVQIDYNDYRPVDGVQTPFDVRIADWESVSAYKFSDVTVNQPIDAARFARPANPPAR